MEHTTPIAGDSLGDYYNHRSGLAAKCTPADTVSQLNARMRRRFFGRGLLLGTPSTFWTAWSSRLGHWHRSRSDVMGGLAVLFNNQHGHHAARITPLRCLSGCGNDSGALSASWTPSSTDNNFKGL